MPNVNHSRRRFVKVVTGTGVVLGTAGCLGDGDDETDDDGSSGDDGSEDDSTPTEESYEMSFSLPGGTTMAPVMTADHLELWDEYNLEAERNPFTSPADLATNYHGGGSETDFYFGASPFPVARVYNETPGRILAKNYGDFFVLVGKEEFESLEDLEGATHGSLPPGTSTHFGLDVTVREQFGTSIEEYFDARFMGPPPMANGVLEGDLDSATLWAPYSTEIRAADGFHIIDSLDSVYEDATGHEPMFAGSVARLDYLEEKREDIEQFLRVMNESIEALEDDPQLMEESGFLDFMEIDGDLRDLAMEEVNGVFLTDYDVEQVEEDVIFQFEKAVELGLIEEMPPEEAVDIIDLGNL